jgi:hypothetical protein
MSNQTILLTQGEILLLKDIIKEKRKYILHFNPFYGKLSIPISKSCIEIEISELVGDFITFQDIDKLSFKKIFYVKERKKLKKSLQKRQQNYVPIVNKL